MPGPSPTIHLVKVAWIVSMSDPFVSPCVTGAALLALSAFLIVWVINARSWPGPTRCSTVSPRSGGPVPGAIAAASPARREELCRIVVERVVVRDRLVEMIEWTPPARPSFDRRPWCPQGDSNP